MTAEDRSAQAAFVARHAEGRCWRVAAGGTIVLARTTGRTAWSTRLSTASCSLRTVFSARKVTRDCYASKSGRTAGGTCLDERAGHAEPTRPVASCCSAVVATSGGRCLLGAGCTALLPSVRSGRGCCPTCKRGSGWTSRPRAEGAQADWCSVPFPDAGFDDGSGSGRGSLSSS